MAALASNQRSSPLADGYVRTDTFDELIGRDGSVAPHWASFLEGLEKLSHEQRLDRIGRINMRVRETGIAHDLFADPSRSAQPWKLDLVPLIIPPATWAEIERGVIQRARLMEALLADIYGPQRLMREGHLPPQLVFSDPSFLRACHGLGQDGQRIQFMAADLARGLDGSWRVVDTHLETPAGIGYALANRTVLTHISGDLFSSCQAMRLAPYFQRLQEALAQRINRPDPTIALLTPGPRHNDFFSHAYLARYLGMLLLEGDDLRVEDGRVYLKTLDGLNPIDLLVRCVAGASVDALELDPSGFLGPVGLVQAVRKQPGLVINALGTAIGENRGIGSYLAGLCRQVLGETLEIPDVAKHWLGDAAARQRILSDLDHYFIRNAFEQTARPGRAAPARDPARLSAADRQRLVDEIEINGTDLVAEEKMPLATSPSYGPGGLRPSPYAIRVFVSATRDGFIVMPGGLAMTVDPGASMALTAPDGGSRDVWVLSQTELPAFKSLWKPAFEAAQVQRGPREMPSRAADNLFWLGRYVEQADWTFRVLRNCLSRIEEDSGPRQNLRLARTVLTELLERGQEPVSVPAGLDEAATIALLSRRLMTDTVNPNGLPRTLANIHRVAGHTRDRLSLEAWRTLNAFYAGSRWRAENVPVSIGECLDLIDSGLGLISAFNGLTHENMTRNHGWSFLDMGRRLSRALNLSKVLMAAFAVPPAAAVDDGGSLLYVLELADSFITYRSRYRLTPALALVLDLLIVDETNPRSIAFQLAALAGHIDTLPQTGRGRGRTEVQRRVLALVCDVRLADVARLAETDATGRRTAIASLLGSQIERIPQLSDAITRRYFSVVEKEPRWMRARSRQDT